MDGRRFERIKALHAEVADLAPEARVRFLREAGADADLIAEIESLCEADLPTQAVEDAVHAALSTLVEGGLEQGAVLGAWTITQLIGEGGMGRVYRAQRSDGHFQQTAAVKLLSGRADPRALRHLARERQILARLVHPNIARLLDGGSTSQGHPFLVMEYVEGRGILEWCRSRELGITAVLELFLPVCAAVAYAHRNLVVHCDIKPSNILVTPDGRPMLLDFGVSRMLDEASDMGASVPEGSASSGRTSAGYTPRYASPEQLARQPLGTPSDIYSLAVTLAELLGIDPSSIRQARPRASLPTDLSAILLRATQVEPDRRYDSVEALAADLGRFQRRLPVLARPHGLGYVAGRWLQRHWPWALAGSVFLGTVGALSMRLVQERDAAVLARNQAVISAEAARAVKDYMVSVFQGADPEISGQRDLPLSEVLQNGLAQLEPRLQAQPAAKAELRGILAGVYFTIGRRAEARDLYAQAVALARPQLEPLALAGLLQRQAYVLYDLEDFAAAEPLFGEALALRERHAPGSEAWIDSKRLHGVALAYTGHSREGLDALQTALETANEGYGEDSEVAARVHLDLMRFRVFEGEHPDAAVEHARHALAVYERVYGRVHFRTADAIEALSYALGAAGGAEEALPLARELVEQRSQLYGAISNQTGFALFSYAYVLDSLGRRLEAIEVVQRCLDIQRQLDGSLTRASARILVELAGHQLSVGLPRAAADNLRLALSVFGDSPSHGGTEGDARFFLGQALRESGQLAEADRVSQQALTLARASGDVSLTWRSLRELAALRRDQGRLQEARALLAELEASDYGRSPTRKRRLLAAQSRLAMAAGDLDRARELLDAAEAAAEEDPSASDAAKWLARIARAELLAQLGRAAEAQALAHQIRGGAQTSIAPGGTLDLRLRELGSPPASSPPSS